MKSDSDIYSLEQFADLLSVSKDTLRRWDNSGKLKAHRNGISGYRFYTEKELKICFTRFVNVKGLFLELYFRYLKQIVIN